MLKNKSIHWKFMKKLLYIYAILVPDVASDFCQFSAKCAGKDDSMPPSNNVMGDQPISFSDSISLPVSPETTTWAEQVISKQQEQPTTCCRDCTCGRNCGKPKESCCFPELSNKSVDDSIETCTYAQSPMPHVEKRYEVFAYYMVDRNPFDGCLDKEFSTQHPGKECGEVDAAYWGSLYPVSSVSTDKIYRNIHCAKCYGVSDAKLWQASIKLGTNLTDELEYKNSNIHFTNIEDTLNVFERRCFNGKIINQCPSSDFFIPETLGMNTKTVTKACHNGTFSPYIHEHVYSNVFCLICNTDLKNHDQHLFECSTLNSETRPFTAILIPSTTTVYQKEQQQLACVNSQYQQVRPKCRQVLCQSGTIFIAGECRLVTEMVSDSSFTLNIVLIPTSDISLLQLQLEIEELSNHLIQTWDRIWKVKEIAVSKDISLNVNTVLVSLIYRYAMEVSMRVFLEQIKRNLNNSSYWTHHSGNESVYLKPSNMLGPKAFSREKIDSVIARFDDYEDYDESIKETLNTSTTYQTVFSEPGRIDKFLVFTISEMFYCEQIELHQNEFVRVHQYIVYIIHMNVLLYKGQFINVLDRDGLGTKIKICLHDSGFSLNISSSGPSTITVTSKQAISVFFTIFCLYSL